MECCNSRHKETFHGAAELPFHSNWELPRAEWTGLRPEDRVRVQLERRTTEAATVDMIADDASVFWVWLDNGRGRVAIHRDDDVKVWFEERRLAGPLAV